MLLCQFNVYWIALQWTKYTSKKTATMNGVYFVMLFELLIVAFLAECWIIVSTMLGFPVHTSKFPVLSKSDLNTWLVLLPLVIIAYWANVRLLFPNARIEHYKRVFDEWDAPKRFRWKIYAALFDMLIFGAYNLAAVIAQPMMVP